MNTAASLDADSSNISGDRSGLLFLLEIANKKNTLQNEPGSLLGASTTTNINIEEKEVQNVIESSDKQRGAKKRSQDPNKNDVTNTKRKKTKAPIVKHAAEAEAANLAPRGKEPSGQAKAKNRPKLTFPEKLMYVLEMVDDKNVQEAIAWQPDGYSFVIKSPSLFVKNVLSTHFQDSLKYESFIRKMNRWRFKRISTDTKHGLAVYYNRLFRRDAPSLCRGMSGGKNNEAKINGDILSSLSAYDKYLRGGYDNMNDAGKDNERLTTPVSASSDIFAGTSTSIMSDVVDALSDANDAQRFLLPQQQVNMKQVARPYSTPIATVNQNNSALDFNTAGKSSLVNDLDVTLSSASDLQRRLLLNRQIERMAVAPMAFNYGPERMIESRDKVQHWVRNFDLVNRLLLEERSHFRPLAASPATGMASIFDLSTRNGFHTLRQFSRSDSTDTNRLESNSVFQLTKKQS